MVDYASSFDASAMQELQQLFECDDPRIERHRPIGELRSIMRSRIRLGEPIDAVREDYEAAVSAYESLIAATNERIWDAEKIQPWWHKDFIPSPQKKKPGEPYIQRSETEGAIAEYLAGSVRTDQLDRMFLDAGIASEMFAFMDEPVAKAVSFSWWGYLSNLALAAFILWVSESAWWAVIVSLVLATGPIAGRLINKQAKITGKLLGSMADTYRTLNGPISSIREVRRALEASRDVGAVWPSPVWVLLEDIEARRTAV